MKRKTIFSILASIAIAGIMPSCTDLDEDVYDKLPADNFGGTLIEVNALVGNTHNTLKNTGQIISYIFLNVVVLWQ